MGYLQLPQINLLQTADVDGRCGGFGFGIHRFAERAAAAGGAETVFDDVFIERIGGEILFRCR